MDHLVKVSHSRLHLKGHLLHALKHVGEDTALIHVIWVQFGLPSADLWTLGLKAPSRIQSHQRSSLSLQIRDLLSSDFLDQG